MPCYTVRETTVDLGAADRKILIDGLRAAGFTVVDQGDFLDLRKNDGTSATVRPDGRVAFYAGQERVVNEIKRAYSAEAVRVAAKRFGYTLTTDRQTGRITAGRRF
jgi:hypothetical protein